jgi:hypothetical protein
VSLVGVDTEINFGAARFLMYSTIPEICSTIFVSSRFGLLPILLNGL